MCPALVCKNLLNYEIIDASCTGCGICLDSCPEGAIIGEAKVPHVININACIKCGLCFSSCPNNSIIKITKVPQAEI